MKRRMKSQRYVVLLVIMPGIFVAAIAGLMVREHRVQSDNIALMTSSWPSTVYVTLSQDDFTEQLCDKLEQKLSTTVNLAVMADASERTADCIVRLQIEGVVDRDQVCTICYDQIKLHIDNSKAVMRGFTNSKCAPPLEYKFVGINGMITLTIDSGDSDATCIMRIAEQRSGTATVR